jgi:hypothetical protein
MIINDFPDKYPLVYQDDGDLHIFRTNLDHIHNYWFSLLLFGS